jgi:hypothetical protein
MKAAVPQVWIGRIGLVVYLLFLLVMAHDFGFKFPVVSLSSLHSMQDALALAGKAALALLMRAVVFVPAGLLAALACGGRDRRLDRVLKVWIPALVVSIALAATAIALDQGYLTLIDLVLPTIGCVFGVALGVAWTRGPEARGRFLPRMALVLAVIVAGLGALVYFSLESSPLPFEPTQVTSGEKRRVYRLFEGKNPQTLPEGKTEELALAARDLNVLLAWGLSLGHPSRKARVELMENFATLSLSARLPGESKYLNLAVGVSGRVENGRLRLGAKQLSVGRVDTPSWLLRLLSPAVAHAVAVDKRVKPLLTPIRSLVMEPEGVRVSYGRAELPRGFVADLFQGEGTGTEDLPVVRAHVRHLLDVAGTLPQGDERFGAAVVAAFDYASARSKNGPAIQENRGAVLALGILLGHWRVQNLVGPVLDDGRLKLATRAFKDAKLRDRKDWSQHFFVSASLTLLAREGVSDAAGLFKEELDADGGSGFSFGDLLADRAGTTFALAATRDEASARALQDRLDRGFQVDDFFPPAADLPEGLTDAEFRARYGGVGGEEYKRLVAEIERRVSSCSAYTAPAHAPVAAAETSS